MPYSVKSTLIRYSIDGYVRATQGLRAAREGGALSAESIEDAVDSFQAEMDAMDELSLALQPKASSPGYVEQGDLNDQELLVELEDLMNEEVVDKTQVSGRDTYDGSAAVVPNHAIIIPDTGNEIDSLGEELTRRVKL